MKILSLFDGIAGARQALKELDIDCKYYASEVDKFAIQVAMANHPDIKQIGDVKEVKEYSNIDLLIGGSPCQDLSIANKERKGLQGERSGLFYEYLRILKETKPKYFILENVNSMAKAAKETITKELFDIEPIMINSALVTAQQRKRLYWVGKLVDGKYRQVKIEQPNNKEIYLKDIIEENVDTKRISFNKPNRIGQINKGCQGDRIYSVNGKSVALSANSGGKGGKTGIYAIAQRGRNIVNGKRKDIKGAKTEQRLETSYSEKSNCLTKVQKDSLICFATIGSSNNRIFKKTEKAGSLTASMYKGVRAAGRPIIVNKNVIGEHIDDVDKMDYRKLTPKECCRLQGFPDDYVSMVSKTQGYKAMGNGFTVPVIKHLIKSIT